MEYTLLIAYVSKYIQHDTQKHAFGHLVSIMDSYQDEKYKKSTILLFSFYLFYISKTNTTKTQFSKKRCLKIHFTRSLLNIIFFESDITRFMFQIIVRHKNSILRKCCQHPRFNFIHVPPQALLLILSSTYKLGSKKVTVFIICQFIHGTEKNSSSRILREQDALNKSKVVNVLLQIHISKNTCFAQFTKVYCIRYQLII